MNVNTKQLVPWWIAVGIAVILHLCLVRQGWESERLVGNEFRQTQTAITAHFIQAEQNFSLAYPTPILGKPWSIPYEFPLYQWSVVKVSDWTGWSLVSSARGVTLLCLYLTLPAMGWLAARYSGLRVVGPLTILFVLTCPLYIFYARSFLIDMMALMFSLWFAVGFIQVRSGKHRGWLVMANVAGLAAGVIKITTLMVVAFPLGAYALVLIHRGNWTRGIVSTTIKEGLAVSTIPVMGTLIWMRFADIVKARNPQGELITGESLGRYVFGDLSVRLDPEMWAEQWRIISTNLINPWLALVVGVLATVGLARGNWRWFGAVAMFALGPVVFPRLYSIHEYYYIAVGGFVALALAMGVGRLVKRACPLWLLGLVVVTIVGAQLRVYQQHLYPHQFRILPRAEGIGELIMASTDPDDVLIIAGNDWASMLPYACQRRALMFRTHSEKNGPVVATSLDNLRDESIGAFVVWRASGEFRPLREEVAERFDLWPSPVFHTEEYMVWADSEHRQRMISAMKSKFYGGVELSADASAEFDQLPSTFMPVSALKPAEREQLSEIGAMIAGVDGDFPISLMEVDQAPVLFAHPKQRVQLKTEPGLVRLELEFGFLPGAHDASLNQLTDGVGFSVFTMDRSGQIRRHWRRVVAPSSRPANQGRLTHRLDVEVDPGEDLWLETDPGDNGNLSFDWVYWSRVSLR